MRDTPPAERPEPLPSDSLSIEPRTPPSLPGGIPLPTTEHAERSDAARNRQLLLDAAEALVREQGAEAVTMDAVARRAGVGKGTVFRRFGNRSGLMHALLDQSEKKLQAAYMFGPPPLGPGAPPVERLIAFGRARLAGIEVEGDVRREATLDADRYASAPYNVTRSHVALLLRQADVTDGGWLLADTLLAALDAGLVLHQTRVLGYTLAQIGDYWETLVRRVTAAAAQ
ncbi:TetR/AcrR family transcriptional regulator [Nocardia otitidiscaviarum]|uniref:TetR/AcrR family transcriptional regulator n=1 Tax=Nocardia otitidiscaviarum TaxID=1823 RepID=A0A516NQ59_9NOCA|nr:TetR/AcrR family transcriptional regulator [Nocardia otitidiscaviarum]MCP9623651.1 TetR/AcrR family transcriptional regulator [Nocardia otitidiscaviarum]QDP81041.1 TetR/AcrR family transcriptional regulator [Nocardia otitidiscaviarum]